MANLKVKVLNAEHPEYDSETIERHRALYEGGRLWRLFLHFWIPKNAGEPSDLYTERKALAGYSNHVGGLVDRIVAALFCESITVDGVDDPFVSDLLLKNCDKGGTPWIRWWRERMIDALVGRNAWVWINLPGRDPEKPPSNRAEELSSGLLDVFLVGLKPEQVIDWTVDAQGNLSGVMFRGVTMERTGPESARLPVHRWTWIDRARIRRWEWRPPEGDPNMEPREEEEVPELDEVAHNFGAMPVVRLELPPGLYALNKLHDPAVKLTRARNDLSWALHRAANALLVLFSKWGDEAPALGHGFYLQMDREDRAEYVEPSGQNFELMAKDVASLRDDLFRVVDQLAAAADSGGQKQAQSGESKRQDWRSLDLILTAYADLVRGAMRQTLGVVVTVRNEGGNADDVVVNGLDSWNLEDLTEFLANALSGEVLVPSETYKKAIAVRTAERILGDEVDEEVLDKIRAEIEAHDFSPPDMLRDLPGPPRPEKKDEDEEDDEEDPDDDEV